MIPIRDSISSSVKPYISWILIFICVSIFLFMQIIPLQNQHYILHVYGLVPLKYSDPQWAFEVGLPIDYGLSFLSGLFLHGGWLHLIVNIWFMWIFAKNIEAAMGHGLFLIFYLVCGVIAMLIQWYFDPQLTTPIVGASGAIAGILGAYFFLYPYAKVVIWVPLLFLPIFVEIPAIAFLGFWVILQLQEATTLIMFADTSTGVAWWSHIGGFIAGAILHKLFIFNQLNTAD